MTNGSPMKLILGFSIPLLFGYLFQQFYNLVDTLIVGRFLGVDALAAVGSTGSLNFLIIGFCMGVCNGFAIPLAHRFGAGDYKAMRAFMMNAVYLAVIFAAVMTVFTVAFCRPILQLMQTPENIIDDAYTYIVIIFAGIPATYLYNLVSGVIRSMGDSKTPLIFLALAAFVNIGLDLLLIIVFPMGVAGAALATVISQAFSGIACVIYSKRKFEILHTDEEERKVNKGYMKTLCGMGVPMGLQYSITAIGSVILQSAVNTLGSNAVASMTAGSKIGMFFCCPYDALGSTMATYGGQNLGAKKLDRLSGGLKAAGILGIGYSILAFVVLWLCGNQLAMFFVESAQAEVIANVRLFLVCNSAFYIPLAFVNIVRFLIQGMGYSKFAILAGVFEMAARTLVGFVFVPMFGYPAGHGQDEYINDHHFHWGYFIHAAAFIEQYSPGWATQWGDMVNLLVRDAATSDRNDPMFPYLRNFSPYAGHCWANGVASLPQGNDQESTSESMQFHSSLIHWGSVTGNRAVRDLGIYMYATEQSAVEEYWFDQHERILPSDWKYSLVSRVFGNDYDNGTFWTADIAASYAIELYPIHGGSFYLGRNLDYVRKLWSEIAANTGILSGEANSNLWHDTMWKYLSFIDPQKAIELYNSNPKRSLKFGISQAQTYHWLHSMNVLGQYDSSVTADYPVAMVFRKGDKVTHVAYNYDSAPRTVTFSDGATLVVEARSMGIDGGVVAYNTRCLGYVACCRLYGQSGRGCHIAGVGHG